MSSAKRPESEAYLSPPELGSTVSVDHWVELLAGAATGCEEPVRTDIHLIDLRPTLTQCAATSAHGSSCGTVSPDKDSRQTFRLPSLRSANQDRRAIGERQSAQSGEFYIRAKHPLSFHPSSLPSDGEQRSELPIRGLASGSMFRFPNNFWVMYITCAYAININTIFISITFLIPESLPFYYSGSATIEWKNSSELFRRYLMGMSA